MNLWADSFTMRVAELLFGGDDPAAGAGRQAVLESSPPWAAWVTLALLIAAAVFVAVIYARERGTGIAFPTLGFTID